MITALLALGAVEVETTGNVPACLRELTAQAREQGLPKDAVARWTGGVLPDLSVLDLLDHQPEFHSAPWDYHVGLVDAQRIHDGQAQLQRHAALLVRLEQQYGVDRHVLVAIWGVETDYGQLMGKRPVVQSLLTLGCHGRRQPFFRKELLALIALLEQGELSATGLTGSWAGALGQTQFMPSIYKRLAVDGDGDGRRDLAHSTADALASTAHYLQRSGWRAGQPWGVEVRLPAGFRAEQAGRTAKRSISQWQATGVRLADGGDLMIPGMAASDRAAVLLPAGIAGPALLVFRNYEAIYAYNAAQRYALAIADLSEHLRGRQGWQADRPTDDPGLDRQQRRQLQRLLLSRGHVIGEADGMIGTRSRRAIAAEQQRLGWALQDGRAGQRLLATLRAETRE